MEIGVFIALYILGSLIFGVFCSILANVKGEDGPLWFLLGCLFNFIALMALAGFSVREKDVAHHTSKWRMKNRLIRKFPQAVSAGIAGALMFGAIASGTAFGSSLVFSASDSARIEDRVSALESWAHRASLEINHWKVYGNPGTDGGPNNENNENGTTQPPDDTQAPDDTQPPEPTPRAKKSCTHKGATYQHNERWTDETVAYGRRWHNEYECRDGRRVSWGSTDIGPA